MKKTPHPLITSLMIAMLSLSSTAVLANPIDANCTFKGIALYGDFKVVPNLGDIKVKVVEHFPDLKVQTTNFPNQCGQWRFTDRPGAVRIEFVDHFPDITIKMVKAFPGLP